MIRRFGGRVLLERYWDSNLGGMPSRPLPWPHAPRHELSERGTYFVTAATYRKQHHFRTTTRLDVLQRGLLTVARDCSWRLEAWAVFSNHYHFVGSYEGNDENAQSLESMLTRLHRRTAIWINRLENNAGRIVWHNYWDTQLTFERSYLARLNYVHQNAVRHGLVPAASQYSWCSARWFEREASPAMVNSIYRFKVDNVRVDDAYAPVVER